MQMILSYPILFFFFSDKRSPLLRIPLLPWDFFLTLSFAYKTSSQGLIPGELKLKHLLAKLTVLVRDITFRMTMECKNIKYLKILVEFSRQNPSPFPCSELSERINLKKI